LTKRMQPPQRIALGQPGGRLVWIDLNGFFGRLQSFRTAAQQVQGLGQVNPRLCEIRQDFGGRTVRYDGCLDRTGLLLGQAPVVIDHRVFRDNFQRLVKQSQCLVNFPGFGPFNPLL